MPKQNQKGCGSTTQEPAGTVAQHKKASGPCHRTGQREEDLETRRHDCARHVCMCVHCVSVVHVLLERALLRCAALVARAA